MEKLTGKGVSAGIAIGKVFTYEKKTDVVSMSTVSDIPEELRKFAVARQEAKNELIELYARAYKKFGISNAKIFEAHQILVDDPDFIETVESMIKHDMVNAEFAVNTGYYCPTHESSASIYTKNSFPFAYISSFTI